MEDLVNLEVLRNEPVRVHETTRKQAEGAGAIAFFGEKYGDIVRVVEAGHHSVELCGGTHVSSLGTIGPLQVVSEASIGSNTRRIEAVTGEASLARFRCFERTVEEASQRLRTQPSELDLGARPAARGPARARGGAAGASRRPVAQRGGRAGGAAAQTAVRWPAGWSAAATASRRASCGTWPIAVRDHPGVEAVGLAGVTGPERVALVVATRKAPGSMPERPRSWPPALSAAAAAEHRSSRRRAAATSRASSEALVKLGEALRSPVHCRGAQSVDDQAAP